MEMSEIALIEDWFTYHAPTERQRLLLETYRGAFRDIAIRLVKDVKNSRERAIALTELRTAAMLVNQAIIFDRD
jgi:hypothetical protein